MLTIKHDAMPEITTTKVVVVEPAKPESYDLVGLTKEETLLILLALSRVTHSTEAYSLYRGVRHALALGNEDIQRAVKDLPALPIKTSLIGDLLPLCGLATDLQY